MKKPKHNQVYVPGFGVVSRSEFSPEHFTACVEHVRKSGVDVDAYIASSYDTIDDEAELERLIEEEEKQTKPKKSKEKK